MKPAWNISEVRFLGLAVGVINMAGKEPTKANPVVRDSDKNVIKILYDPESSDLSKSGKSFLLASSHGFVDLGNGITMSYNVTAKVV